MAIYVTFVRKEKSYAFKNLKKSNKSVWPVGLPVSNICRKRKKLQFNRQTVGTKVSLLLNSLGYSTCFSRNPHATAVNSQDSFLGVTNRESRLLRRRGFLTPRTHCLDDAFGCSSVCVTSVIH